MRKWWNAHGLTIGRAVIVVGILFYFGACGHVAVACWHRGGTVIKNWIDWPTCVEVTRR